MTADSREPEGRPAGGERGAAASATDDVPASGRPRLRASARTGAAETRTPITTETLFGARREVLLSHAGTLYRLRITSKDKLILTK